MLVEILEAVAAESKVACLPAEEVDRLVARFGSRVRGIGRWNKSTDGSVEIPLATLYAIAGEMGDAAWSSAIVELRSRDGGRSISDLIDRLASANELRFRNAMSRFQAATDPAEVERLGEELQRDLFGAEPENGVLY